jgi:hypothetical protein
LYEFAGNFVGLITGSLNNTGQMQFKLNYPQQLGMTLVMNKAFSHIWEIIKLSNKFNTESLTYRVDWSGCFNVS